MTLLEQKVDFHRCADCVYWKPALTYYGEPTGNGGCQFSTPKNRKGNKLRQCDRFQEAAITRRTYDEVAKTFIRQAVTDILTELDRRPTNFARIAAKGQDLATWARHIDGGLSDG